MQMYPAYSRADVLAEFAISFFALLNYGYRARYRHYQMLAQICLLPSFKNDSDRTEFLRQLDYAAKDPSDILKPSSSGSTDAEIRQALGG